MLIITRPKQLIGSVEMFVPLPNGKERIIQCSHNDVVYEGFDVLAEIMSGNLDARINAMYFKFHNTGAGAVEAVTKNLTAADFQGVSSPYDYTKAELNIGNLGRSDS